MIALNLVDANDQLLEVEMDGVPYYVGQSWNEAGQLWAISLRNLDRQLLVSGIRVVPLYPLLHQVRRPGLPLGELFVDCVPGTVLDRRSFADGAAALWYVDEEDIAELAQQ